MSRRRVSGVAWAALVVAIAAGCGGASDEDQGVSIRPSAERFETGSRIDVTIANDTAGPILVPYGPDPCATFVLERREADAWRAVERCPSTPDSLRTVAAGAAITSTIALAGSTAPEGGSVAPVPFNGDLRDLPVTPSLAPGEQPLPASEVPIGILPSPATPVPSIPASDASAAKPEARLTLEPGTYRLRLRYLVGPAGGEEASSSSAEFVVVG